MKNRVMSGVVLILFLAAIVVFNVRFPPALNLAVALISILAINEIIQALGISKEYALVVPSLMFAGILFFVPPGLGVQATYFIYTAVMFAVLIFFHESISFRDLIVVYSMTLLISTMLGSIIGLREFDSSHGMFYVIIAIFSAWISDTGAFVAGSLWGSRKLCPKISPKKTVEGAVGGLVLNVAAMLVFGYIFHVVFYRYQVDVSYLSLLLIGIGGSVMSILGDLSFSLIKRSCHIKDFGELIPGHGGILDRFDSVIFVAPFVYLLVQFLPIVMH
ncbi:phosphatidate cytidylyltransferase [Clostridium minihomine]|uniref:phosphatidate cytidylyltransferase n=1 Tax=Clostridium minihomine TaxID=2045012 RepID=UPI000C76D7AB|nr:phosphatidate cytidylyltransferase [Clostridium minihomine]